MPTNPSACPVLAAYAAALSHAGLYSQPLPPRYVASSGSPSERKRVRLLAQAAAAATTPEVDAIHPRFAHPLRIRQQAAAVYAERLLSEAGLDYNWTNVDSLAGEASRVVVGTSSPEAALAFYQALLSA